MADCSGFIEPLNLECMFVNVFAGNPFNFVAISFIVIMAVAARFQMSTSNGIILSALYIIIFSQLIPGIYLLTILIIGLIGFALIKTNVTGVN